MTDLFQILNVGYDADFIEIRQAYYRRLQNIRRYVREEERAWETERAVQAWRVLGSWDTRVRYLEELRQNGVLGAGHQQHDARFQQKAARRRRGFAPPDASPPAPTGSGGSDGSAGSIGSPPSTSSDAPTESSVASPTPATSRPAPSGVVGPEGNLEGRRPAQWFKSVATNALTNFGHLQENLTQAYEATDRTRRRLVVELRHTPELMQAVGAYFRVITNAFDALAVAMAELEDYIRPATVAAVRDEWDYRTSILTRLAVARDVAFKFCACALMLQEIVGETVAGKGGNDEARKQELLRDLRAILDQWLQLISSTLHPGATWKVARNSSGYGGVGS
ncbi:uncharacterized protein PG986_008522 [Apiospora aurea]|uniref:J domain-containing protein n=1 Tax=Apiospora aurea TaxID=335848 RepID=A0ABR1QFQ3_9PEZI